jgi:hypothetical protein
MNHFRMSRVLGAYRLGAISGFMFFALASAPVVSGEEIDRLLAAVNGKAITEGDLTLARVLNPVLFAGAETVSTSQDKELSQLIDFEILRQELKNFGVTKEDENEVASRFRSLRERYALKGGLSAYLQTYGLQESELISYVQLASSMLRFVNSRFRPFVSVTQEEIKSYYENVLTPQVNAKKGALQPLSELSAQIEAIVREKKINEDLDQWIANIRRTSRIERFDNEKSRILLDVESR